VHAATVSARLEDDAIDVHAGSSTHIVRLLERGRVSVDGEATAISGHRQRRLVEWHGRTYVLQRVSPLSVEDTVRDRGARGGSGVLTAPMPGRIVKVSVEAGQQVTQNQPLVVLEAMKMEHVIEAPHSGVVTELGVAVGNQVTGGQRLLTIGSADETQIVE
jgi:3-methylcrotonyl-CoA carboxylase alpha subunit